MLYHATSTTNEHPQVKDISNLLYRAAPSLNFKLEIDGGGDCIQASFFVEI